MLEYFAYKKFKKNKEEKEANEEAKDNKIDKGKAKDDGKDKSAKKDKKRGDHHKKNQEDEQHDSGSDNHHEDKAVLKPEDESFLEELLSQDDDGPPPPLPPRIYAYELDWPSDNEGVSSDEQKKDEETANHKAPEKPEKAEKTEKAEKKPNRLSFLFTKNKKPDDNLKPESDVVPPKEADRETKDLSRVLDRLNLSAKNNKVISQSKESELLQKFTQVFKDLVNGVPTAYDDLTKLIEDRDGTINKLFEKLPSSLQKLVTQLPEKLTSTLAPELLAVAAESQGLKVAAEAGVKGAAKKLLMPQNLAELVTKPGAIVGMLKAIVEVLKTRWPAFIGMNVLWSVALSLLLVVLWYCYKRGREERLLREKSEAEADSQRIEELPDDPTLPAPEPGTGTTPTIMTPSESA